MATNVDAATAESSDVGETMSVDTDLDLSFDVVADGDVVLVVGPEKARLRVHSLFLTSTSKPFAAMLGPNFLEGQALLHADGPVDISLPEDNAAACKILCCIMHHRYKLVPRYIPATQVLEIAMFVDKYDCVDLLNLLIEHWLLPGINGPGNLMYLATAAYVLRDSQAFKTITSALIFDHVRPYVDLVSKEVESAMAWRVVCMLDEQRSITRLKLAHIIQPSMRLKTPCSQVSCSGIFTPENLSLLQNGKFPGNLLEVPLSKVFESASSIPKPRYVDHCTHGYAYTELGLVSKCLQGIKTLKNNTGLCLSCVFAGKSDPFCSDASHMTQT